MLKENTQKITQNLLFSFIFHVSNGYKGHERVYGGALLLLGLLRVIGVEQRKLGKRLGWNAYGNT